MGWTAGAVTGLSFAIFFLPIATIGTIWLWKRRDKQPIKARGPPLVVANDVMLILYIGLLCLQRIIGKDYPCIWTVWTGHIGTIILFNIYLWRCWKLYFAFNWTQSLLDPDASPKTLPWFLKNRRFIDGLFLCKVFGTLTILLALPCGILAAIDETIPTLYGDDCKRSWGDSVLTAYVVMYIVIFVWFGYGLRNVEENFGIKLELKITSALCSLAVVPWFVFNLDSLRSYNNDETFPTSTLFLILAGLSAFAASTLYPLWRSIFEEDKHAVSQVRGDVRSLQGFLSTPEGVADFKAFLTKEFSVENLLFFLEVEDFRNLQIRLIERQDPQRDVQLFAKAQDIYKQFIETDARTQVNLPDPITRSLETALRKWSRDMDKKKPGEFAMPEDPHKESKSEDDPLGRTVPTIFDPAQLNIFRLMNTDSFPRFARTAEYRRLVERVTQQQRSHSVYTQMGIA